MSDNEERLREYLQRTVGELRTARRALAEERGRSREPLAIVSASCRLPGGIATPEQLWDAVDAGRDLIGPMPTDRGWPDDLIDATGERPWTSYTDQGGFLDDVAGFDAGFFGISPREALAMDPQQRILLEVVWESFERAGILPADLRGTDTGVFVGATSLDYGHHVSQLPDSVQGNVLFGRSPAITAGRISYVFDLHGPAVTTDTMCSSSLVALHQAAQSIRADECSVAIVAGTATLATPLGYTEFSTQGGMARDGRCRSFAEAADGTGWGEGVVAVMVERLSRARELGHPVLAVLRGTATNHDGASNGLTAPSRRAQRLVISSALTASALRPGDVDLIEAHGTGTVLGDPIEVGALQDVFGRGRDADSPLMLGSLKSNLGHTASAAGLAGVLKVIGALQRGRMPRTLHVDEPSRSCEWGEGTIRLLTEPREWPAGDEPRRAGVSAFGASGTNAHVVLEGVDAAHRAPAGDEPDGQDATDRQGATDGQAESDAQAHEPASGGASAVAPAHTAFLWQVSGRSEPAMREAAARLHAHLAEHHAELDDDAAARIAAGTTRTRQLFEHRSLLTGSARTLPDLLRQVADGADPEAVAAGDVVPGERRVAFVFPGQGSQWVTMGARLLREEPLFARALQECSDALEVHTGWSVVSLLQGDDSDWVDRVERVQPALWAIMVALARVWRAWGVEPAAVAGHSQGEVAAACVAGILSVEDAARIVAVRSGAVRDLVDDPDQPDGGMLSVAVSQEEISAWLAGRDGLEVAAVNSPRAVVVAGPLEALTGLAGDLEAAGVRNRLVRVGYASHTRQMEQLEDRVMRGLAGHACPAGPDASSATSSGTSSPTIPFVSSVTGRVMEADEVDAGYWYQNLRQPVDFAGAARILLERGCTVLVEVSPHPILRAALEDSIDETDSEAVALGSLHRDVGDRADLLSSLAESVAAGVEPDWAVVSPGEPAELPTYPFQHRRYWIDGEPARRGARSAGAPGANGAGANGAGGLDTGGVSTTGPDGAADDDRRYRIDWSPLSLPAAAPQGRWVLLQDRDDALDPAQRDALHGLFAAAGAELAQCTPRAEAFEDPQALARAIEEAAGDGPLAGVLSTAAIDPADEERMHAEHPGLPRAVWHTVIALRSVALLAGAPRLWVLTADQGPTAAAVWAVGRTAGLEAPAHWGGLIELPSHEAPAALAPVLGADPDAGEDQVRIRSGRAEGRRLVPSRLPRSGWDLGTCALITGGTGGVGRQLAVWLAKRGVTTIATLSRSGGRSDEVVALVGELQAHGARLRTFAGDVGDADVLRRVRSALAQEDETVGSVWHLAVGGSLEPLDDVSLESAGRTTLAKVAGARALVEVFDEDRTPLVLFSSISSIWGSGRHGLYAAANGYLDGLAAARAERGIPTLSVAWGLWDPGADGSGGSAAGYGEARLLAQGLPFMDPADGLAELDRLLGDGDPLEVVTAVDWPTFRTVFESARPTALFSQLEQTAPVDEPEVEAGPRLAQELAALPAGRRVRHAQRDVVAAIAEVLDAPVEDVHPQRALRDLGLDSLTSLQLRRSLQRRTGLRLPASIAFDRPTARLLAEDLIERLFPAASQDAGPQGAVPRDAGPGDASPSARSPEAPPRGGDGGTAPDRSIDDLSIDELIARVGASGTYGGSL